MLLGAVLPPLTVRYAGFVNGDGPASLAAAPTVTVDGAPTRPGHYPLRVSGAADPDYTIGVVDGTLRVIGRVFLPLVQR